MVAFVHPQSLDVLAHERFDELEIVTTLRGRSQELSLEQAVEPEQRRIACELFLDERTCLRRPLLRERQREDRVEQIERRILLLIRFQHPERLSRVALPAIRVGEALGDERQECRILRLDPLPRVNRRGGIALLRLEVPEQDHRPRAGAIFAERLIDATTCRGEVGFEHGRLRELAVVMRDLLEVRGFRDRFHPARHRDRLRPVFLLLVDGDQEPQGGVLERRAVELRKELFGAVEKTSAMKVLRELEDGGLPLVGGKTRPIEQVLVHPRGPVDLALPPEQAPECEMQVDRLRVDLDDLDERLDGLVRLLVQQKVESPKIRQRQRSRFAQQMLDVDPRRGPSQREKESRDRQQPPEFELQARRPVLPTDRGRAKRSSALDGSVRPLKSRA